MSGHSLHALLNVMLGSSHYQVLRLRDMDQYLDAWHLMAYDYAGSWDSTAGHQSNIHSCKANPSSTPFSTHAAVQAYKAAGIAPSKIVLGMPLYGRAFMNTHGPGQSFSGVGEGSYEPGVWDYKVLPKAGAAEKWDQESNSSYSFDAAQNMMVSYDSPQAAQVKAKYIRDQGLGGGMWWETVCHAVNTHLPFRSATINIVRYADSEIYV